MGNLVIGGGKGTPYQIENSLMLDETLESHLYWTPAGSGTDTNVWSLSMWFKGQIDDAATGNNRTFFSACDSGGTPLDNYFRLYQDGSGTEAMKVYAEVSNVARIDSTTNQEFRDPTAWNHLLLVVNTDEASITDRGKLYLNGTQLTWGSQSGTVPTLNYDSFHVNKAYLHEIGAGTNIGSNSWFDGKIAEVIFLDGIAASPSDFGEFHGSSSNIWRPINPGNLDFSGTNSFWLDFADNTSTTTLGYDVSGNANHWTLSGISTTAQDEDTPTNNALTLNSAYAIKATAVSNGGRTITNEANQAYGWVGNMRIPASGKWYWEVEATNASANVLKVGMYNLDGEGSYSWYYGWDGVVYNDGGNEAAAAGIGNGDVVGIRVDADAGTISYYINNTLQKTTSLCTSPAGCVPVVGAANAAPTYIVHTQEQHLTYSIPTDHYVLNTKNVYEQGGDPTVLDPSDGFYAAQYVGDGAASKTISNTNGFDVGLTWIKGNSAAYAWRVVDSTRGATKSVRLDSAATEATTTTEVLSFPSGGVEIGSGAGVNTNATQFSMMQWKDDPVYGMDIVTYTGTGSVQNVSHNLGIVPSMIIVKKRTNDTESWGMYHERLGNTALLRLDTNAIKTTASTYWNSTTPTSSVFTVNTNAIVNDNTDTYVAWLFGDVDGYSKAFSYTGNGSPKGACVNLGFKPAWILIKRADVAVTSWVCQDSSMDSNNVRNWFLRPDVTDAILATDVFDVLDNGFRCRTTSSYVNTSGSTYVGFAFAEKPFALNNNGAFE